jgi:FkbM family methyltransferase
MRVLWTREYRRVFLRTRVAASTEHDRILAGLKLHTIVDIGANRGQFALCVRRLYPLAQIFSFEPLSTPAQTWRRVFAADGHATLFNKAIAAKSGPATMHVSRWDSSSSLLPIAKAQSDNFPFTEEASTEAVETTTLETCISEDQITAPALLKLDVQGSELTALQGCTALLDRFTYVYVEASFIELYAGQALATEVLRFLLDRGFSLMCVANLSRGTSVRPIQADFLFVRAGTESSQSHAIERGQVA